MAKLKPISKIHPQVHFRQNKWTWFSISGKNFDDVADVSVTLEATVYTTPGNVDFTKVVPGKRIAIGLLPSTAPALHHLSGSSDMTITLTYDTGLSVSMESVTVVFEP